MFPGASCSGFHVWMKQLLTALLLSSTKLQPLICHSVSARRANEKSASALNQFSVYFPLRARTSSNELK